jgi:AcrR family transcriptional regulator
MPDEDAMTVDDPTHVRTRRTADERRIDVIRAAITEFSTHGLHGGSTETIAALAGISQPYVLRLFKTKKALFLAAVAHVCDEIVTTWQRALKPYLAKHPESTPLERLETIGQAYFGLVENVVELRLVLQSFASAEDDDVRALAHEELERMFTWVRQATDADEATTGLFFANGMMLTVAASIRAVDAMPTQAWARAYLSPQMCPEPG